MARAHGDIDLAALEPSRAMLESVGFVKRIDLGWHTRWGWFDREIGELEVDYVQPAELGTGVLVVCPGDPLGAAAGRYTMPPNHMDPPLFATLDGVRFRMCTSRASLSLG